MSDTDDAVEFTYEALTTRRSDRPVTELPRLVGRAAKLVWDAGRGDLATVLALAVAGSALGAGRLLAARSVLGRLSADDPQLGGLLPAAGALVALTVAGGLAGTWAGERNRVLGERVSYHAQTIVATAACEADLVDFERPSFHNRLQRALSNLGSRPMVVTAALASLVGSIASVVAISVAILTIQPLVFAVLLLSALPLWLVSRALGRRSFGFDLGQTEADRRRGYLLGLMVQKAPAKELRAFQLAPHLRRMLGTLWDRRIDDVRAHARRRALTASLGRVVNGLLVGAIVLALGWMVTSGRLSLANAGVVATGALLIGQSLQATLGAVGQLYESALFLEDAESFVRTLAPGDAPAPPTAFQQLTLDAVRFRYPGADRDALHDVSITVRAGELVALVGANGSGKTTLAKIIAQLYAPTAGQVSWNGQPVLPAERAGLRDEIAVLFQDFERYLFTAAENVGFGRVDALADHDRVLDATVRAGIDRRIAQLPDGFASLLGPEFFGGTDLSGGEWQRVALARAFFRRAPLLVLDEPTSAMDPDAEHDLFLRLRELWADRAVVLVSHRFSNVMSADRIVVLDQGRIVEVGTHAELLAADGRYAAMFRRQAEPYQLVGDAPGGAT